MLLVNGLTKRYGDLLALDDVGFGVEPGQIVGFLGPNGAGKTTTMRAIMRLVALDAGEVTWSGAPVDPTIRQRFGYMPAERGMYPKMRVRDHLVYYAQLSGLDTTTAGRTTDDWLERLGLADRGDDPIEALSSGNQQRVQSALALLDEPDLLVLDEPFSGLDPIAVDMLSDVLREQVERGAALLLSSHQLDLVADVCSAVVIVDRGRVVLRGDVAELRASSPTRLVQVEFASATAWQPDAPSEVSDDGRRHRVSVAAGTDPNGLITDAHSRGDVVAYSFAPPDLSEVFLGVVGRETLDDPERVMAEEVER
ncbi:MAG: ATP-binding cassette domain-containing protein [Acidimicrobiia bacterium]|nr:ATP-binding cassette domain-containing protein [Acidimicrobiia bacterium]